MMRTIVVILLSIYTISLIYAERKDDSQVIVHNWISEHKNATPQEIASFIESLMPMQESIEKTYTTLYTIINSYSTDLIPSSIYLLFAQIASLRFDFETASTMYYAVYSHTRNPEYLLNAAIQEFQRGNFNTSSMYLQTVLSHHIDDYEVQSSAYILQSELLMATNSVDFAYSYIENVVNILSTEHLTSAILYQYFRLATLMHDDENIPFIRSSLLRRFENSLEATMIANTYISPLPLPSLLLSTPYDVANMPSELGEEDLLSQEPPPFGYQIGIFSILENAYASFSYFSSLIENTEFNLPTPVLTKKTIEHEDYYQIIIPLSSDANIQETEVLLLKQLGIEGFVISHN